MSAFPPPPSSPVPPNTPPPAAGGQGFAGYPPPPYAPGYGAGYDARTWKAQAKAQARMAKAQMRMQRDGMRAQMRAQARAARRYSVVGPLFLLGLGLLFLLIETGRLSWGRATLWYGHWWPLLLIGAGLVMLAEWALNGRRGALLGGGMVTLLIFLGSVGWTAGQVHDHLHFNGENFNGWSPFLGDLHEEEGAPASSAVAADGTLLIHNPHGDVSVTGASEDGQVHVTVHKELRGNNDGDLARSRQVLQPGFTGSPAALELSVGEAEGSHADLQVTVPRGVTLTVDASHGAVTVAEMHAPVSISAGRGEINLNGITGPVTAHLRDRNGSLSAHSVTGGVSVDGRGGDMNFSDIAGPVAMQGEFFGTTHLERVNGAVSFDTFRTQFKAARLDGDLEISSGSGDAPLQGQAILGPLTLHTRDRVITLDRVQGNVDVHNANGSVSVTSVGPLGTVSVQSTRGSVDVGVPATAAFTLSAQTHDGSIENDFGLPTAKGDDRPSVSGTVGHGGPAITLHTDDGDVTLRKSTGDPLPAVAPPPPPLVQEPSRAISTSPAPKGPAPPKGLAGPPKAPKAPPAPKIAPPEKPSL